MAKTNWWQKLKKKEIFLLQENSFVIALWNIQESQNILHFKWLVGWFVGFYGISTYIGYLTPNRFFM